MFSPEPMFVQALFSVFVREDASTVSDKNFCRKALAAGWWVVCTSIKTEFPFLFKSLLSDQVATKALQSLFGNARLLQKGLKRLKRIHLYTSRVSIRSAFASVMFAMDMYISCGKVLNLFCSKS